MAKARLIVFILFFGASAAGASPATTPRIVAAANAFLATLSDAEKGALIFAPGDTAQKQRWSNLPAGIFKRTGLMWGDLKEPQRAAWLAVMRATLSAEGYRRVVDEWRADDALAPRERGGAWTRLRHGLLLDRPDRQSVRDGALAMAVGRAPRDDQCDRRRPARVPDAELHRRAAGNFTDANGAAVRPLGDIERDAFALMNWLDADQQRAASLAKRPADVVLGPGEDGKTIAPAGLPAARMSEDQRAALMRLIGRYSGLANDEDAAERMSEIRAGLDQTYFAWNGPTTPGAAVYFRVTGPAVVIEYSAQGAGPGGGAQSPSHIHGIYRDPTNDYAARFVR